MDVTGNIAGNTICALGDSITIPVQSYVELFREEFEDHIENGGCSFPAWWGRDKSPRERPHRQPKPAQVKAMEDKEAVEDAESADDGGSAPPPAE